LKNPPNAKIATNTLRNFTFNDTRIKDYAPSDLIINTQLRGTQNFYVYIKGNFEITVWKNDLNWNNNSDTLKISLFYPNGTLIKNETIADDGITKISKEYTDTQSATLSVNGLKEGPYKLKLENNADMLIKKIKLNQNKFVADNYIQLFDTPYSVDNYNPKDYIINTSLRGTHNLLVYVDGDFSAKVSKRDINGVNGLDELNMTLYDMQNRIIKSEIIADDGITNVKINKNNINNQQERISAKNLDAGTYRLELKNNADMIIISIELNTDKVMNKGNIYLASNTVYFNDLNSNSTIYFKTEDSPKIYFQTDHAEGVQIVKADDKSINIQKKSDKYYWDLESLTGFHKIVIPKNDLKVIGASFFSFTKNAWFDRSVDTLYFKNSKVCTLTASTSHDTGKQALSIASGLYLQIYKKDEPSSKKIPPSKQLYALKSEKGDITLKGCGYYSFTNDSWFDPFEAKSVAYKEDANYLIQNADYVLVDYTPPKKENGWLTVSASFKLKDLYIQDNKLNILVNTPHLSKNESLNYTIPIDWVNLTVHKDGIF
jgi:hypothetical protein